MLAKRILIVEDEQITARDLGNMLQRIGHVLIGPVADGAEAVLVAAETKPDLILMDFRLDGPIDGLAASIAIASIQPVPIIYITGNVDSLMSDPSKLVHPFLCMEKPISSVSLKAAIDASFAEEIRPN